MAYIRVIPRDLFNEADLLKCYGQIFINLETANLAGVELLHDGDPFEVEQDENDGSISLANVTLIAQGRPCRLSRSLNSRGAWPLMLTTDDGSELDVFDRSGQFSEEFVSFVRETTDADRPAASSSPRS